MRRVPFCPSLVPILATLLLTVGTSSAMAAAPSFVADATVFEAARKEGKVVYYCAQTQEICEYLGKRFEQLTGIVAEVTRMPAGVQYDRILRERQAGLKVVDVFENGLMPGFLDFKERNLLEPYMPPPIQKIGLQYRDKDGSFYSYSVNVQVIVYNPKIVPTAQAPKAWKDLYDPKWKGKIAIGNPKTVGIFNDWLLWQSKLFGGWEFLKRLKANDPWVGSRLVEGIPLLVNGERPIHGAMWTDPAWSAKLRGDPIEIAYPEEGVIVSNEATAILKDAPHPNAAKVFVDFLFAQETGQWLADQNVYVPHAGVSYRTPGFRSLSDLKTLVTDPIELKRELKGIRDRFAEVFGG